MQLYVYEVSPLTVSDDANWTAGSSRTLLSPGWVLNNALVRVQKARPLEDVEKFQSGIPTY